MSLSPEFLDDLRARLKLSDVVGRKVTWDQRKSRPGKGDFWAPCPFHQEKTPSFHVDDRKGFYHCFGCQAKGDMITFVRETERVSFIEAVEILAREAGVDMPARTGDPKAEEKRERRNRLIDAMEQAVQFFGLAFRSDRGGEARDYARMRGLKPETLKRFEIGFAPRSRTRLTQHFKEKGLLEEAVGAGLVIRPEDGGAPYDRFRGRLMFPIRDRRGSCIAFGGRALSSEQQAKYLNSPETEIFHKGRVLFNHGPADAAARRTGALIVAEGYMDAIALAQAGFEHATAPLGTAITEDQLTLMWRIAPEPIIALDGDAAGLRAAERLVETALPLLKPGRSLGFCLLPEGKDPDDLIGEGGATAMKEALDRSLPLIDMLWRRETEAEPLDTPERRAALDIRLRRALDRIRDPGVRAHYGAEIKKRRSDLFHSKARPQPTGDHRTRRISSGPSLNARKSALAGSARAEDPAKIREAAILLIALVNHAHIAPLEESLENMTVTTPIYDAIRDGLISALVAGEDPVALLTKKLGEDPVALLTRIPSAREHPYARRRSDGARVLAILTDAIDRHRAAVDIPHEREEALQDFRRDGGEEITERLRQSELHCRQIENRALEAANAAERKPQVSRIQEMLNAKAYMRKKKRPSSSNR